MNALLVLKPSKELFNSIFYGPYDTEDDIVYHEAATKLENVLNNVGHSRDALEIAKTNPDLLAQVTFSIRDSLALSGSKEYLRLKML